MTFQDQVRHFEEEFVKFINLLNVGKQNDANRIADLTQKWKSSLTADPVDPATFAALTAQHTELENSASVHHATVLSQLQATKDAFNMLKASSEESDAPPTVEEGTSLPVNGGTIPTPVDSTLNLGGEVPVESVPHNIDDVDVHV